MRHLGSVILALFGISGVQLASNIDPSDIGLIGKLLIEVAIAIVTLLSIFRLKKR